MEDLIVKISEKCNFKCTFCSSDYIAENKKDLDIQILKDYLLNHEVNSLIINGGDPLCTSPRYYEELLDFLADNSPKTDISFTTNLYDFWQNPEKWVPILKRVGVCTSFQYGEGRRLGNGEVFTEQMFREVFDLFEKKVGYKLLFISVIDDYNEEYVLKTVQLAKELGTTCKINPCLRSGRALYGYDFSKMFEKWLDIIEAGLEDYEANCKLLKAAYKMNFSMCPFLRDCRNIKCMNPDGVVTRCGAVSDDIMSPGFLPPYFTMEEDSPKFQHTVLSNDCFTCKLFGICNSCHKRIMDIREAGTVKTHCLRMLRQLPRAKRLLGAK